MKHKLTLAYVFSLACFFLCSYSDAIAQSGVEVTNVISTDSLAGFNEQGVLNTAAQKGLSAYETQMLVARAKREYILRTFYGKPAQTRKEYLASQAGMRLGPQNPTPQAPCTNMDFETGTFAGWTGSIGDNTASSAGPLQNIIPGIVSTTVDAPTSDCGARHTIMTTASGNDPCGGFPTVAPGGNYSVRLGNQCANYQGEILEQTFTVAPGNTSFTYQYAVVLNDGGHSAGEQPYFKIEMFDQSGNLVPCSQYYVEASGSIPGFLPCGVGTYYKPWTTVNIDLSTFLAANVTIRFTAAGCIFAGHYGYAYIDASCLPYSIALTDSLCQGSSITLTAPAGAQSYNWTNGVPPGPSIGTGTSITVNAAGNYYVEMISVTGCTTFLNVNVGMYPQPTAGFTPTFPPCSPNYTFTNTSTISSGGMTYQWDFGDPLLVNDTSISQSPVFNYPNAGTYTVTLIVTGAGGCADTITQ
ncbi:MAG TPA: PKD domain-containing protein, partial [Bacteroidia bacterium]|nr:PKD domain-containing protein [Bacteroidia bacterium]